MISMLKYSSQGSCLFDLIKNNAIMRSHDTSTDEAMSHTQRTTTLAAFDGTKTGCSSTRCPDVLENVCSLLDLV